jgi:hypothetical protein
MMTERSWRVRILAGTAAALAALTVALAADVLSELGVTQDRAHERFFDAITGGYVSMLGNAKVFLSAAPEKRVVFVQGVTAVAKAYAGSADFKKRYADFREANKPSPPKAAQSVGDLNATQRKQLEDSLKQMKEQMKQLSPDMQKEMQQVVDQLQKQLDALGTDPQQNEMMATGLKMQHEAEIEEYNTRLKEWETKYPVDANALIATRLREFLDGTKDIDYNAQLVEQSGKKRFADANLEQKSSEWKLCFRAGKPATDAARTFAAGWLKELQSKGIR